jgi:hypothetical protein
MKLIVIQWQVGLVVGPPLWVASSPLEDAFPEETYTVSEDVARVPLLEVAAGVDVEKRPVDVVWVRPDQSLGFAEREVLARRIAHREQRRRPINCCRHNTHPRLMSRLGIAGFLVVPLPNGVKARDEGQLLQKGLNTLLAAGAFSECTLHFVGLHRSGGDTSAHEIPLLRVSLDHVRRTGTLLDPHDHEVAASRHVKRHRDEVERRSDGVVKHILQPRLRITPLKRRGACGNASVVRELLFTHAVDQETPDSIR